MVFTSSRKTTALLIALALFHSQIYSGRCFLCTPCRRSIGPSVQDLILDFEQAHHGREFRSHRRMSTSISGRLPWKKYADTENFHKPRAFEDFQFTVSRTIISLVLISMMMMMMLLPDDSFAHDTSQETIIKDNSSPPISSSSLSSQRTIATAGLTRSRYWDIMRMGSKDEIQYANERLMEHGVGLINTNFYDNSGGVRFTTKDMHDRWKVLKVYAKEGAGGVEKLPTVSVMRRENNNNNMVTRRSHGGENKADVSKNRRERQDFVPQSFIVNGETVQVQKQHMRNEEQMTPKLNIPPHAFDSRADTVNALKWLISTLDDPYSKYLSREELEAELKVKDDGFLGLGAIVDIPPRTQEPKARSFVNTSSYLSSTRVANLPRVTAIAPDSPAERAGIVVGDRIAAIGSDKFIGLGREEISKRLDIYRGAENYVGYPELTVAKPIFKAVDTSGYSQVRGNPMVKDISFPVTFENEQLLGYKLSRVRLPTASIEPFDPIKRSIVLSSSTSARSDLETDIQVETAASFVSASMEPRQILSGGDSIVHWELLTPETSIFEKYRFSTDLQSSTTNKIGYIRLTRFSRLATMGYTKAVEELEKAGAQSYIIDVRNNYGGVIQESMLTASTLLRDPQAILCYTLNSRGGFTPHDAEEFITDKNFPGYLLSSEPKTSTLDEVKRDGAWIPPSSYASIHEQRISRNYKRPTINFATLNQYPVNYDPEKISAEINRLKTQKKLVILMNEGTASAAEVFVSSLHDNGRTIALIGTKTYGKGLVQHTFPMPDGGGLRLTVAEYLTPALQHVTKVGGAQYKDGLFVGGGVKPDIFCPSTQGIPKNIGADLCVGLAVDALEDASATEIKIAMNVD